ncbi:ROK family protein [Thermoflexus sp.]|uniref:ROK family transcriptional regulator n=1 Tax=Thermoflexus sp. TaxID=1969742 RepID=UPI0035E41452
MEIGRPEVLERINRSAILELIRMHPGIPRAELGRRLGLSPATVTRLVGQLIEDGLVVEREADAAPRGYRGPGRRPRSLYLNHEAYHLIGVDLGGTHLVGAIANLNGEIMTEVRRPSKPNGKPSEALEQLMKGLRELLDHAEQRGYSIRGIGIGVPGVTDPNQGRVIWAPAFEWRDLPLKAVVEHELGIPTFIENDVNLAAFGEKWFGAGKGVRNLVCVFIGTGIGAGLILNGELYRGHHYAAGEVGYVIPERALLHRAYETFGCTELLAAGPSIARRAVERLPEFPDSTLRPLIEAGRLEATDVFRAAGEGDPLARAVAEEALDYLAIMLASVISVVDPEMILLGGGVARAGSYLLEGLQRRLEPVVPAMPILQLSALGDRAGILGAVAYAIFELEGLMRIRRGL